MSAQFADGELRFVIDGRLVIEKIFVGDSEGRFLQAQWQRIADNFSVTDKTTAKSLVAALRKVAETDNAALRDQVVELHNRIEQLKAELWAAEEHMNEMLFEAYQLTAEERRLVENG